MSAKQDPYRRSLLRQERSQKTRRRLIRAAVDLWGERGYDTVTAEEICTAAGVGRTTFYFHFESKDQLLTEVTWATASGVAADVENAVRGGLDRELDAFIEGVVRRVERAPKSPAHLSAMFLRNAVRSDEQPGTFPGDRVEFGQIVGDILLRAQQAGEVVDDVDTRELGEMVSGVTIYAIFQSAAGRTDGRHLREHLLLHTNLILHGYRVDGRPATDTAPTDE